MSNTGVNVVLACLTCATPFIPMGGIIVPVAEGLIKLAEAAGWLGRGDGHICPACIELEKRREAAAGVAAAIAGALAAERAKKH